MDWFGSLCMEGLGLMNTVRIYIQTGMAQILTFQKKKKNKQNKRLESNERNPPRSNSFGVLNLLE